MEPDIIAKDNGLTVIHRGGRTIVIHDAQGEPGRSVGVLLDKAVFEELQAMCRMAIHSVADMGTDRAYIAAVFIARLFGGDVYTVYTSFTETRR